MTTETTLEREVKLRLGGEEAWAALRTTLGQPSAVLLQTNTYFDTPDRRLRHTVRLMVRVRDENGVLHIQVKDKVQSNRGMLETRERAARITVEQWRSVHRLERPLTDLDLPLARSLRDEAGGPLFPIGSVVNRRDVYPLASGYVAELDRTEFPGGVINFEIELEMRTDTHTPTGALKALSAAAPGHDIHLLTTPPSKYSRFLQSVMKQERE